MSVKLIILLGGYVMCWQGYKLRRRVNGLGHISLILTLTGILSVASLARLSETRLLETIDPLYINIAGKSLVLASCVSIYLFRLAVEGFTISSGRVQSTIYGGLLMAILLAALQLIASNRGVPLTYSIAAFEQPVGASYYFLGGCYYGTLLFLTARWTVRYTRDKGKHFRRGMRIAAIGIYGMSALCIGRALPVACVALGGPKVIAPGFLLGAISAACAPFVFGGLSYPLLASRVSACRVWWRQRRICARLNQLWTTCKAIYPEIASRGIARSQAEKLTRLKTECFDGLARLLAHPNALESTADLRAATDLRDAVQRYESTRADTVWNRVSPTFEEAGSIPQRPDDEADTEMLLTLADILGEVTGAQRRPVSA